MKYTGHSNEYVNYVNMNHVVQDYLSLSLGQSLQV